jgi:hypothetical protein
VTCRNCGAALSGRYCSACGQRHDTHAPTVGHFLHETAETLTHVDSRLWRTLWYLLSRPGFLTQEFFAGRRARYLPPIRLYIVISVTCFLLLALMPSSENGSSQDSAVVTLDNSDCSKFEYHGPWKLQLEPRLRAACQRVVNDDGAGFGDALLRALPKAMFVLLPLFALFMMPFYLRPLRLYVEHLIFLVHNHSAVFMALSINMVLDAALPAVVADWLPLLLFIFLIWYCWRGMTVFYANSNGWTVFKIAILGFLYLVIAGFVLAFTGIATLLSI